MLNFIARFLPEELIRFLQVTYWLIRLYKIFF